jgi:hypothetical protein
MSKILIVSKTKMSNNKICIGGIDMDNKLSVRLLNVNGYHESINECLYNIRDVWKIEYQKHDSRPLPHSEDIRVISRNKVETLRQDLSILSILKQLNFKIYNGNIRETFEGKLQCTNLGAFYISVDDIPNNSTCFWICDRDITRNDSYEKIRYCYNDGTRNLGRKISYVGIDENPTQIIPKGTLIRLSLAHWWSPQNSTEEERCYLQLSGWYDIESQNVQEMNLCNFDDVLFSDDDLELWDNYGNSYENHR